MENKTYVKTLFIVGVIILLLLNVFGRMYGLYLSFVLFGVFNFVLTYFLLKINPFKKNGFILVFIPFVLQLMVVSNGILTNHRMPGIIGFLICVVSSLFAIIVFKSNKKIIYSSIYAILFLLLTYNYFNLMNYYYYKMSSNINIGKPIPYIGMNDKNGNYHLLKANNKILVIDLWANNCGFCINSFPKFEKLKKHYSNDKEVIVFALNIIKCNNDIKESQKYLTEYTFDNYYTDRSILKKLNFSGVPQYMIVGKKGLIKYFGSLNLEKKEKYNNIYDLIENEK